LQSRCPLSLSAFCEEEITIPKGFALGVGMGQRAGDVSVDINVTSPYLHHKVGPMTRYYNAFRISGDYRMKSATSIGGTTDSIMEYYVARIGIIGAIEVSNFIRMYADVGGESVFPTAELASSTDPCFGLYGSIGSEVFVGRNLVARNGSIFMEIGIECPIT
jgi:hypothetical protein